jgi:hypothetical protein
VVTFEDVITELESMKRKDLSDRYRLQDLLLLRQCVEALEALTDPRGHIWHGPSAGPGECTGECRDVRAAIAKARGLK